MDVSSEDRRRRRAVPTGAGRPALLAGAMMLAAANGGCSAPAEDVRMEGLPYSFPASHVRGFIPRKGNEFFIRVAPPGKEMLLILDSSADARRSERNEVVISGINPSRFTAAEVHRRDGEVAICASLVRYQCGLEIFDHGVRWNVLFNQNGLRDLKSVKSEAATLIVKYRS